MVQATLDQAEDIKDAGGNPELKVEALPGPEKLFAEPVQAAAKEFFEMCRNKCNDEMKALETLFG